MNSQLLEPETSVSADEALETVSNSGHRVRSSPGHAALGPGGIQADSVRNKTVRVDSAGRVADPFAVSKLG